MEFENEEDKDYVVNSLVLKMVVLGDTAVDGERNIISIKSKTYTDKQVEQPICSLTQGRRDMATLDLPIISDNNPEVEFKLTSGTGPVFITCIHLIDLPTELEDVNKSVESEDEEDEEIDEELEEEEDDKAKPLPKRGALKNGKNGKVTNGKAENGKAENGKGENGKAEHIKAENGLKKDDIEMEEKYLAFI